MRKILLLLIFSTFCFSVKADEWEYKMVEFVGNLYNYKEVCPQCEKIYLSGTTDCWDDGLLINRAMTKQFEKGKWILSVKITDEIYELRRRKTKPKLKPKPKDADGCTITHIKFYLYDKLYNQVIEDCPDSITIGMVTSGITMSPVIIYKNR